MKNNNNEIIFAIIKFANLLLLKVESKNSFLMEDPTH